MGRRSKGEGSFLKRPDGIYRYRFAIAPHKMRDVYGGSKQECLEKAAVMKGLGPRWDETRATLGAYLKQWLATKELRDGSRDWYTRALKRIGESILWTIPIGDLTAERVKVAMMEYRESEEYSKGGARAIDTLLRSALNDAALSGLLKHRIMDAVPTAPRHKRDYHIMTAEERERFVKTAHEDKHLGDLYLVALITGMREGELLALDWVDVDFQRGTIRINKTQRTDGTLGPPKTESSIRTIKMTKVVRALLLARLGRNKLVSPHVFFGRLKKRRLLRTHLICDYFHKFRAKLGMPNLRFHDLRHNCATLLLQKGVPVHNVTKLLGHASVMVTINLYGHAPPGHEEVTADAMDSIFGDGVQEGQLSESGQE